jgi:type IV pilus assembly protein PilA
MNLLAGLKTPLMEIAGAQGLAKACSTDDAVPGQPNANPPVAPIEAGALHKDNNFTLAGKYVDTITADRAVAGECGLVATFKNTGVNDKLAGKKITFTYVASNASWACKSTLDPSVRPKTCDAP